MSETKAKTALDWIKEIGTDNALTEVAEDFYATQSGSAPWEIDDGDVDPVLPDSGRDQDKGANKDAKTWKSVQMKDDPKLWKVTDDKGVNVADQFDSQEDAEQYIDYHIWKQSKPPVEPPKPPIPGDKDPQGIIMIMASKPGGRYETKFVNEVQWRNYRSGKQSEWSNEYTNKADPPVRDAECTYYVKVTDFKDAVDTFSWKRRSGSHSSKNPTAGTCYDFELMTDGTAKKTLEVERPHPSMHSNHQKPLFPINENLIGKWIGIKTVDVNVTKNGKEGVYLAYYLDYPVPDINNPPNKWRLRWEVLDSGQLDKGLILKPFGGISVSRIDGIGKGKAAFDKNKKPNAPEYKHASVREIIPKN